MLFSFARSADRAFFFDVIGAGFAALAVALMLFMCTAGRRLIGVGHTAVTSTGIAGTVRIFPYTERGVAGHGFTPCG